MKYNYRHELWQALHTTSKARPDNIYQATDSSPHPFTFNEQVVEVFPDMIGRSVPGYWLVTEQIGDFAQRFYQAGTNIYDLGCSLGAASLSVHHKIKDRSPTIIAVDSSEAMIQRFTQNLAPLNLSDKIHVYCQDIRQTAINQASIVILNYTLQFLNPTERLELIHRIYQGMVAGGILLVSEKIRHSHQETQQRIHTWHHDFKRNQGYSDLEISQKRRALENVMIVDTLEDHYKRFADAGFAHTTQWFQCYNFVSFLVQK